MFNFLCCKRKPIKENHHGKISAASSAKRSKSIYIPKKLKHINLILFQDEAFYKKTVTSTKLIFTSAITNLFQDLFKNDIDMIFHSKNEKINHKIIPNFILKVNHLHFRFEDKIRLLFFEDNRIKKTVSKHILMDPLDFEDHRMDTLKFLRKQLSDSQNRTRNLDFSHNNLGVDYYNMKLLEETMKLNPNLKGLELQGNRLGVGNSENIKFLIDILNSNKSLNSLYISNNELGKGDPYNLSLFNDFSLGKNITTLCLSYNCLSSSENSENFKLLAKVIETNQTLEVLYLRDKHYDKKNKEILKKALEKNKNISCIFEE